MQKNRKSIILLVMVVSLILIVIMAYPVVDEHIHASQKGDLFLDQAQENSLQDTSLKDKTSELPPDTDPGEPLPEITLSLEMIPITFTLPYGRATPAPAISFCPDLQRTRACFSRIMIIMPST